MTESSRLSKYKKDLLPPLLKFEEVGMSHTIKVTGDHEYTDRDDNEKYVLDAEDEHSMPCSWIVGAWHALEELERVDPQPGDWITITRLEDKGRSHQYRIEPAEPTREEMGF